MSALDEARIAGAFMALFQVVLSGKLAPSQPTTTGQPCDVDRAGVVAVFDEALMQASAKGMRIRPGSLICARGCPSRVVPSRSTMTAG